MATHTGVAPSEWLELPVGAMMAAIEIIDRRNRDPDEEPDVWE